MLYVCPKGCRWFLADYMTPYCRPGCHGWGVHPVKVIVDSVTCPKHRYHCKRIR